MIVLPAVLGWRGYIGISTENNVGSTTRHVRCDRYSASLTSFGNDSSLSLMLLGVQDVVRNALFLKQIAQQLRLFDAGGTNEYRSAIVVKLGDTLSNSVPLGFLGHVDVVATVGSLNRLVRRNFNYFKLVNFIEFFSFRNCRTGHAS